MTVGKEIKKRKGKKRMEGLGSHWPFAVAIITLEIWDAWEISLIKIRS